MAINAAFGIRGWLRALRPRPKVRAGVYYRDGQNLWFYVPPYTEVIQGKQELGGSPLAGGPRWQVRVVAVDAAVAQDDDAPAYVTHAEPAQLKPVIDLHIGDELIGRIIRRAQRFIDDQGLAIGS